MQFSGIGTFRRTCRALYRECRAAVGDLGLGDLGGGFFYGSRLFLETIGSLNDMMWGPLGHLKALVGALELIPHSGLRPICSQEDGKQSDGGPGGGHNSCVKKN